MAIHASSPATAPELPFPHNLLMFSSRAQPVDAQLPEVPRDEKTSEVLRELVAHLRAQ